MVVLLAVGYLIEPVTVGISGLVVLLGLSEDSTLGRLRAAGDNFALIYVALLIGGLLLLAIGRFISGLRRTDPEELTNAGFYFAGAIFILLVGFLYGYTQSYLRFVF